MVHVIGLVAEVRKTEVNVYQYHNHIFSPYFRIDRGSQSKEKEIVSMVGQEYLKKRQGLIVPLMVLVTEDIFNENHLTPKWYDNHESLYEFDKIRNVAREAIQKNSLPLELDL